MNTYYRECNCTVDACIRGKGPLLYFQTYFRYTKITNMLFLNHKKMCNYQRIKDSRKTRKIQIMCKQKMFELGLKKQLLKIEINCVLCSVKASRLKRHGSPSLLIMQLWVKWSYHSHFPLSTFRLLRILPSIGFSQLLTQSRGI